MTIDKYGVEYDNSTTEKVANEIKEKAACPKCGSKLDQVAPPHCPQCGVEPFSKKIEDITKEEG
jgi:hypothetical protein